MKDITKDAAWAGLGWVSHAEFLRRKNRLAFWKWVRVVAISLIVITLLLIKFTPK